MRLHPHLLLLLSLTLTTGCVVVNDDTAGPPCEVCDGIDNDGDGAVDEDFADSDRDGIADCIDEDTEACDGIDNNGDGAVDEGYADTDADGIADCVDPEDCDGVDNNGDGSIDEGFDLDGNGTADCFDEACNCEDDDGDGEVDEGLDCLYKLELNASADDKLTVYFDGSAAGSGSGWSNLYNQTWAVPAGSYSLAVQATDVGGVVAGFNARVTAPGAGATDYDTASGVWSVTTTDPTAAYGTAWTTGAALGVMTPDSAYAASSSCTSLWSFSPSGAPWVWAASCSDWSTYRNNYYYVEVDVCPDANAEDCDGEDNDGDGLVDEGYLDSDFDGVADCVEEELCNGWDDNADGVVDEGFSDTDGDGDADCIDPEECDGLDNNGNGTVDEGYADTDGDGKADCIDVETCDGLDNDGNGIIDDGFPDTDGDGKADCIDEETCDGLDNDGDGGIDENFFDTDADGIADCVDTETCDEYDNDGDGVVNEGFSDTDGDGTADCIDPEECDGLDNNGDGVVDEGYADTDGDGTADCIDPEECDGYDNDGDGFVDEGFADSDGDGTANCIEPVGCGDGVWDSVNEECDDGGNDDGDGCSADCTIEDGYSCINALDLNTGSDGMGARAATGLDDLIWTWSEYADGSGSVPAVVSGACASTWTTAPSIADWVNRYGCATTTPEDTVTYYSATFELGSASAADALVLDGTIWADNSVYDILVNGYSTGVSFGPAGFLGAGVSFGAWPSAYYQAGINTITVIVYNDFGPRANPDGLLVYVPDAFTVASYCDQTCGDGVQETWEACDDGNTDDGDGCSALCVSEELCNGTDDDFDGAVDEGFSDADADGLPDCIDEETCDGIDNDGDGFVDEDFTDTDGDGTADCMEPEACDCEDNDGDGLVDEDEACEYDVDLKISADDYWTAYIDGSVWGSGSSWSTLGTLSTTATSGDHAIAVYAYDGFGSLAGMNARVEVTGAAVDAWDTGDGLWLVSATNPSTYSASSTWTTTPYTGMAADSAYLASSGCRSTWGSGTKPSGGEWVWRASCSSPTTYPANWFLLEFEVCPEADYITADRVTEPGVDLCRACE